VTLHAAHTIRLFPTSDPRYVAGRDGVAHATWRGVHDHGGRLMAHTVGDRFCPMPRPEALPPAVPDAKAKRRR